MHKIGIIAFVIALACWFPTAAAAGEGWRDDPVWHDGLVEKATYAASRVIYGQPRSHTAVVFTNKEQHDLKTLTKAAGSTSTVEVFKHNVIEVVPTPNYEYKFEATSHFTVDNLQLTRLDVASQEFCGTSFKQYLRRPGEAELDYWSFSYMPESGRVSAKIPTEGRAIVPEDGLFLWLRDYDFASRQPARFWLLPSQKSNRATPAAPIAAEVRYAGEENGTHKLSIVTFAPTKMTGDAFSQPSRPLADAWLAKDRLHVLTRYVAADGQSYELQKVERVDYWTIRGE